MQSHSSCRSQRCSDNASSAVGRWIATRWPRVGILAGGCVALAWLLLRTGSKPTRCVYPCQQAAFSAASFAFGATIVSALLALRRGIARRPRQVCSAALAFVGITAAASTWNHARELVPDVPLRTPRADYRAEVFHVSDCPQDPVGDRFVGLDNLLTTMGRAGLKLYRSEHASLLAGTDGIIAAGDVVLIKINYQWGDRGGTNVDLLRGLIHRLLAHPDGFAGEVVVCENAQFNATSNLDRSANNAQDTTLSPHDVVEAFRQAGAPVSHYDWTDIRSVPAGEYSTGDLTDGYVLYDYDARWLGKLSYPKFRTADGTYISLRDGVWDPVSATYDRTRLKLINLPVLKSHHAVYGMTGCVKHYMGVVTIYQGTNAHGGVAYGALGALMGELGPPDLNILDCIWVGGDPYVGPAFTYAQSTRRDELVASLDPVAADIWAARNILIPTFLANGYTPPWPTPSADPDDPAGKFRQYLDRSMSYLLAAGYDVTNDPAAIDTYSGTARFDADGDGDVDLRDGAALQRCAGAVGTLPPECSRLDVDASGLLDAADMERFAQSLTGPAILP